MVSFATVTSGGGSFFKPKDHLNDIALLVEAKEIRRQVRKEYEGTVSYVDQLVADITYFLTTEDVETATPSTVEQGTIIESAVLVKQAEESGWIESGDPALVEVTKPKRYYAWKNITDPDIQKAASEYYDDRESFPDID